MTAEVDAGFGACHALDSKTAACRVVPATELDDAVNALTRTLGERSPTALVLAKRSYSDNIRDISMLVLNAVKLFDDTAESNEGVKAFTEKRKPDFHAFVK